MKLTILRKERDELIETLRDSECFEFDAPEDELLEDCCKGKRLNQFQSDFSTDLSDDEDPEPILEWTSESHARFHQVCKQIAELEQSEYKKAMGWNP